MIPAKFINPKYIAVTDFDERSLLKFSRQFHEINNSHQPMIPIVINSFGGNCYECLGMIDLLKTSSKPICTLALSKCMSAAAILLSAGTEGYRFASPLSTILIHESVGNIEGSVSQIENEAYQERNISDTLFKILDKNCNKPKGYYKDSYSKYIAKHTSTEWYLNPKEALKHNLINKIGIPKFTYITEVKFEMEF